MKTDLRAAVALFVPFLFAYGCMVAPDDGIGDADDGQTPGGGSGGSAGGGTAGTPSGGATSGGSVGSGGSISTGGVSTGGVSTGGASTGGASTGGVSTGGVSTGGVSTGGAGGAPTGGIGPGGGAGASTGGVSGTGPSGGRGGSAGASGGRGGTAGAAGKGGSAGSAGKGGSAGTGSGGSSGSCATWPAANGAQSVSTTIQVSGTYDGMLKRFTGSGRLGTGGQDEGQLPLFELANGATLKNVILGNPAADGVHCSGSCTLENIWWEDVGEDAATFRGSSSSQTMIVRCGGARAATDKVFQHNGGGTLTLQNFTAENFNKLYRSCGNCTSQYARHVILQDVTARMGQTLVGINTNYSDTADFDRITLYGQMTVCERYTGNSTGAEPVRTGNGPDSQYCRYETGDITQR